jgi:tetratricopeptide (TPR) repeat protein
VGLVAAACAQTNEIRALLEELEEISSVAWIDADAATTAPQLAQFDDLVVVVVAQLTATISLALANESAIVLRPKVIDSEVLPTSNIAELQAALRNRETFIFATPVNARAQLRTRLRRPKLAPLSAPERGDVAAVEQARMAFQQGHITAALRDYEAATADGALTDVDRETSALGVILCLLLLAREQEARDRARGLRISLLSENARLTAARAFTALSLEIPDDVVSDSDEYRAFAEIRAGNVPAVRPSNPDLVLQAVVLLGRAHRFETAANWLLSVSTEPNPSAPLQVFFLEVSALLLEEWSWNVPSDAPLDHETARGLLTAIETTASALGAIEVDPALNERSLRAQLQIAMRCQDSSKSDLLGNRLIELGVSITQRDDFEKAVEFARAGDADAATKLIGTTEPEWRGRFQRAMMLFLAKHHAQGLAILLEMSAQMPGIPIVESEIARRLAGYGRYDEARAHAETAFQLLPGLGQRLTLAECLLASGDAERSASLTRDLVDDSARARTLFAQALEPSNIGEALAQWERYLSDAKDDWRAHTHVAGLYAQVGNFEAAAKRSWKLVEKWEPQLPAITLYQVALLQNAAALDEAERVRRITYLHDVLVQRGRTEDDRLRVSLWMHLKNGTPLPETAYALAEPIPPTNVKGVEEAASQRKEREQLLRLYRLGHISMEAATPTLAEDAAELVVGLGDENMLAVAEPPATGAAEQTLSKFSEIQLGLHELLALARLALLPALEQRLGPTLRLRVFRDVADQLLRLVLGLSQESPREQHAQATRLLAAAEGRYTTITGVKDDACWVSLTGGDDELDLASVLRWMRDTGALSVNTYARASTGLAMPEAQRQPFLPLGLRAPALRWLVERDLLAVVSRAAGGQLRILHSDLADLRVTIARTQRRTAALTLASDALSWLGRQQVRGAAVIAARPEVALPSPRLNALLISVESVFLALTAKEDLLEDERRCLVAMDGYVRDLLTSAVFVPGSLHSFIWTEPLFRELRKRYVACNDRVFGLPWLGRQLAPERSAELGEELLGWGDSSALSEDALVQLARDYPRFNGRAAEILDAQDVPLVEASHARHPAWHFSLAKLHAGFLQRALEEPNSSNVYDWWRGLLARWHRAAPPQQVWLLSWVMSVLVDSAPKAYVPIPDTDRYVLSPDSPVDAAARALVEWSLEEKADILGPAITEILLTIDGQRDGKPRVLDLTPIVVLLGNTNPPSDTITLSHSWVEPLAILSCVWPSNPLADLFERLHLSDGREVRVTFSELLAGAVKIMEDDPAAAQIGLDGVRFQWALSPTERMPAQVPLEAVVLCTKPDVTRSLGMEVASKLGRLDGPLCQLLVSLSQSPSDQQCRRAFALRATASPMRIIRRTPALLAYWGRNFALPGAIAIDDMDEVRALLTEPEDPSEQRAFDRFLKYADTVWKDKPYLTNIAAQCARMPGFLGWQWAKRTFEVDDTDELERMRRLLLNPQSAHFGDLWCCIATNWLDAARSVVPDERQRFAESIDKLLEHVAASRERGQRETNALRCVRDVIARLGGEGLDAIWLTFRLYGWWFELAVNHQAGIDACLAELAVARQPSVIGVVDDACEPFIWADTFDVRLSSVLNALAVCPDLVSDWATKKETPPWTTPLSKKSLEKLINWASEEPGTERQNCDGVDWLPPLHASTAALAALFRNGGKFSQLPGEARERWLSWIPLTEAEERVRPRTVVLQLIHFAVVELASLTPLEGALLADRCLRSNAPYVKESPITALAIAAAAGQKLVSLDEARARVLPHIEDTDIGRVLVAVYLDAVLDAAAETLRAEAVTILTKLGRAVSVATLADVVKHEPSFAAQEALREKLLAALSDDLQSAPLVEPELEP